MHELLQDFLILQQNGISNLVFLISSNSSLLILLAGVAGCIALSVKEEIDAAVREEQNII